jgi:hypothetical protein
MLAALAAIAGVLILGAPDLVLANGTDWADTPDPFVLHDRGRYYAYSTGANVRRCDGSMGPMFVPHRSTTSLRNWGTPSHPACFADVLPGGPGAWAVNDWRTVWAPTVFRNPDNSNYFVLLYTARLRGTGKQCIGRATSGSAGGPFTAMSIPLICPPGPNWALDPNAYVGPRTHNVWIQWRQDASASESRLYGALYSHDGTQRLTSARLLFSSNQISWDEPTGTARTVENPAFDPQGSSNYLFYSGNAIGSNYATGWADCGATIRSGGACSPIFSSSIPWIGYSRRSGGAVTTTPEDLPGPGGMSFVSESTGGLVRDGSSETANPYVVLHWGTGLGRPMVVYKLAYSYVGPALFNF